MIAPDGDRAAGVAARAAAEGRHAFGGFVGPSTLAAQVLVAAPYLFDEACPRADERGSPTPGARLAELAAEPLGWWSCVLEAERLEPASEPSAGQVADYFGLCLAAHWASAPTYVPTDVDAKIRRALWRDQRDVGERARMVELALGVGGWDVRGFSARSVEVEPGRRLGGHDGEWLSVLAGALVDATRRAAAGDGQAAEHAEALETALDGELTREAALFGCLAGEVGREGELLAAAAIVTHNVGDVNQGLGVGQKPGPPAALVDAYGALAQRGDGRYGGAFAVAAAMYRELLASEGHRHYPLRAATCLRTDPSLLLPVPPLLDAWGAHVARFAGRLAPFGDAERAEVVAALVEGVRRVKGQRGYQRALAGFEQGHPGGFQAPGVAGHLPASVRKALARGPLRKQLDLPRPSFESELAKRARAHAARLRRRRR